jgi:ferredoxin-NADP reductase
VVLIGGGTGVTPFVAFMEDAMTQTAADKVWLHYGARCPELLVFADLASRWATGRANFHLRLYAEEGAGDGITAGRISLDAVRASLESPETAHFYLCGPQPMIDVFSARLQSDFRVCPDRIHLDQWE